MRGYFITDRGQIRSHNEDAGGVFSNAHAQHLAVIADGMGGHKAGDVASELAISHLRQWFTGASAFESPKEAEEAIQQAIKEINLHVYEESRQNEELSGMGTTIVAALCTDHFVTIAHIGDSRCYLLNEEGFKQVTEDHSLVNELVRSGQITEQDAENHPRKNVLLRALGTDQNVEMDVLSITWDAGDRLLLCSDGLSNKLDKQELLQYLTSEEDMEKIASQLVSVANDRGGEDNISLIIADLADAPVREGA
ncbi:Stp1/IreP family PP2C-type Ser/Thr phosphatase [Terribacillus sp. DMT04]|uniref:Stp1/IreP family PP2C-type Ser/Thr phosphatase n=1 Tax=Terribacillus sp. DMT04 TaxID=2850441 RepID=UPI001C2B9997|nr:Stp1/IreP family PP2C-type Ser/Thr phosphatase [Terribacillus sp. DMT04]QXE03052.1 Stp1/IreP family PP2C-type Ser/Thr phosphatase [Terribacillus sp. DMT04]